MGNPPTNTEGLGRAMLELFEQLGSYGKTAVGGVSRLAASDADRAARDYLCRWLEENNCEVVIDTVGNIFGILDLKSGNSDAYFFCGSHLDSQPKGGRFDGTYGVVCACLTGRAIEDATRNNKLNPAFRFFVIACWTNEEGSRFQPSMMGSGVFAGTITEDAALNSTDETGTSLREALASIDYFGEGQGPRPSQYFEIHIEQGPKLEAAGVDIGVVTSSWGARKLRVEIIGRADHTGPTPMTDRKDALLAAAHLTIRVHELTTSAPKPVHGSVGRIIVDPNSPNTVAERATLWVELRSGDEEILRSIENDLLASMTQVSALTGCKLSLSSKERRDALQFDHTARKITESALNAADIEYMRLSTIAGHDATRLQRVCPSTLMFVPSRGGVSHSPHELTTDEAMTRGLEAMTCAVSKLISNGPTNSHPGAVHA